MKIIDTHLHLWDTALLQYPWLQEVPPINKTFLIEDYHKATEGYDIAQMVFVQCECLPSQTLCEMNFVQEQRNKDSRIAGAVAYAPLEKGIVAEPVLHELSLNPLVKSVRRMNGDAPGLCLEPDFLASMQLLLKYNFSCDVTIKPPQVDEMVELISRCPENNFILDHLGKPRIATNELKEFKENISRFAALPNCVAKISGLITEANWDSWTTEQLKPYIETTIEQFGFDRIMFGSDWPVVTLAGSFKKWVDALIDITKHYSSPELEKLFYYNAKRVYRLD